MPVKRDAKGKFATNGGPAVTKGKPSGKPSAKSGAGVVNGVKIPAYIAKRSLQVAQKQFKADQSMANQAKVLKHAKTAGVDATASLTRAKKTTKKKK